MPGQSAYSRHVLTAAVLCTDKGFVLYLLKRPHCVDNLSLYQESLGHWTAEKVLQHENNAGHLTSCLQHQQMSHHTVEHCQMECILVSSSAVSSDHIIVLRQVLMPDVVVLTSNSPCCDKLYWRASQHTFCCCNARVSYYLHGYRCKIMCTPGEASND